MKKKIAFCWFGQYRSMEDVFSRNIKNIQEYDYDAFHFYSVWNERGQSEREFDELGLRLSSKDKITHFDFEKLWTFENGYIHENERYNELIPYTDEFLPYNAMKLHFKSFLNDITANNYDLVVLLRCDVYYKFNLDTIIDNIKNDKVYVSKDYNSITINDTLFIGKSIAISKFIEKLEYNKTSAHSDWIPMHEYGNLDEIKNINMKQNLVYLDR